MGSGQLTPDNDNLISGRTLARNVLWNLAGQASPLIGAVFAIPILVHHLGTARFGILTLGWVFLGYFSLFDLGLGRALTQMVARELGLAKGHRVDDLNTTIWTALLIMLALGVIATAGLLSIAPWVARHLLKVPISLQTETERSLYLMAVSIPLILLSAGLRGILEAHQQFAASSLVRTLLGVSTFAAPVIVLPFSSRLEAVVGTLVLARAVACIAYFWLCRHVTVLDKPVSFDAARVVPLLRLGGWMTVSNTLSPLMVYGDRVFIGITLSVIAVTYYATPYEVVTKLLIITGALTGVLFPAFSTSMSLDPRRTIVLFRRGLKYVALILFPIALTIVMFAEDALRVWLGPEFALKSAQVLKLLAIGVFVNSLGQVAFALVQAAGRADLTAKLHLFELPIYAIMLFLLLNIAGINGVAIAWVVRVSIDTLVLLLVVRRLLPNALSMPRSVGPVSILCVAAIALGQAIGPAIYRWVFLISALTGFAIVSWSWLSPLERRILIPRLKTPVAK